jgi:hypothetical protein
VKQEIVYTKTIRIGGIPLCNPFSSLEELASWLEKTKGECFSAIKTEVTEWKGEKQLCITSTI